MQCVIYKKNINNAYYIILYFYYLFTLTQTFRLVAVIVGLGLIVLRFSSYLCHYHSVGLSILCTCVIVINLSLLRSTNASSRARSRNFKTKKYA